MYATLRDTTLYFDVEGAGLVPDGPVMRQRPVAMLIHGGPGGEHAGFKPAMSPLADTMQLVYFDHRGHGRSGRGDPARYTLDENVEDMEALRRHLGTGPIVSIGTSYGGMVAMAHAARYPDAVAKLILLVTASHHGFLSRAQQFVRDHGTPEQQRVSERVWSGTTQTPDQMAEFYAIMGPLYSRRHDPAAQTAARTRFLYTPDPQNRAFGPGGTLRTFDLRPELGRITAPTLIIAGAHDWICPPDCSEEIHRLIPGSQLQIFADSSPTIRADEPEALNAAIRGFVSA